MTERPDIPQDQATIPGRPILSYFRRRGRKFACVLCRILDWLDPHHCEKAIERDEGKRPGQYDDPRRAARRYDYPPRSDWS